MEIGLDDAYSLSSPDDNRKLYAKWAATYESDFVKKQGYRHPQVISEIFHSNLPPLQSVLDVGAGTGLVGLYLSKLRPNISIDGIDISPEMLEEARKKNVYRNLYERDLTNKINDIEAPYDALITIGTFTHGHLQKDALQNLFPLVKENGFLVLGVNEKYFYEQNFSDYLQNMYTEIIYSKSINVYDKTSEHHLSKNVVLILRNLKHPSRQRAD